MKVLKKITPMFNHILTTANRIDRNQTVNGIILAEKVKGGFDEYQTVVAVGPMVHNIEVGQVVCIDPSAYGRPVHSDDFDSIRGIQKQKDEIHMEYYLPTLEVNGEQHLYLADRDIAFIVDEYEDKFDEPSVLIKPEVIC